MSTALTVLRANGTLSVRERHVPARGCGGTSDEKDLLIDNYSMIRADNPMDIKRGGVCIYHKDCLAVTVQNFSLLSECIILEIEVDNKKLFF